MKRPGTDHFLVSGEFHYFRVPKEAWRQRLATAKAAGLTAVSIYVPWNWHVPEPGGVDFVGRSEPERDLLGALEAIASEGLDCIFRPGPFITAEWRNGGIPDWLLDEHPEIVALSANDLPATGGAYPALTYAHPVFREYSRLWLEGVFSAVAPFLSGAGGPVTAIQIDDEPSYFQKLVDPMAVDYNPLLLGATAGRHDHGGGDGSPWTAWLDERHGGLSGTSVAHGARYTTWLSVAAPRTPMSSREQLPLYLDWLYFKLHQINEYCRFLYEIVRSAAPGVPLSMLYPYLQPLLAREFCLYAQRAGMDVQVTNECYLALNAPNGSGEQKVGAVVACHEAYNMWRAYEQGPPVTMELQSSNASYISTGSMEMLYAATVARGMQGVNFFMMVGGRNPSGYENETGAHYDISAPVALDGTTRHHYATIRKFSDVVGALGEHLEGLKPRNDTYLGCYAGYEASAMAGAAFLFDAWGHQILANMGDMGLAEANSLASLLTLSSVSFGCIDLECESALDPASHPQMWVPALDFMPAGMQERLLSYVRSGGHLILLPVVPTVGLDAQPCRVLWDAVFQGADAPDGGAGPDRIDMAGYQGGWDSVSVLQGPRGESLVAPGRASNLPLPPGSTPLVTRARDGAVCGFTRTVEQGKLTVLGFRLQYAPGSDPAQHSFVADIVESSCGPRACSTSAVPLVAMLRHGPQGGLLTVLNPADCPASARIQLDEAGGGPSRRIPECLDAIDFDQRGGRILPLDLSLAPGVTLAHSTWELVGRRASGTELFLSFDVPLVRRGSGAVGEVLLEGAISGLSIEKGRVREDRLLEDGRRVLVLESGEPRVSLTLRPA